MSGTKRLVTLAGKPLTLLEAVIKAGQKAPDFRLLATAQHAGYEKAIDALKNVVVS